jgi:hypothetical protein
MNKTEWLPALQTLGWDKQSRGAYRVIDLNTRLPIATASNPDQFMLENGIPNLACLNKLSSEIQWKLDQHIRLSFIDASLLTKAKDGRDGLSHEIPSDECVQALLNAIGFKHSQGPGGKKIGRLVMRNPLTA